MRTTPRKRVSYMINIEKRCVGDDGRPAGWATLKTPLFKSRKPGEEGRIECLKVMEKFVVPRSCYLGDTLYRYRLAWIPEGEEEDCYNLRSTDERISLPKGFRVSDL